MKFKIILFFLFCFNLSCHITAQLSHGGSPVFLSDMLRSSDDFYFEMPAFDINEMLEEDKLNEQNMKGAFRFAKKFYVNFERGKSGRNYTLADGTKVWQIGIRSKGAYSINVLFSEFKIPEGGKLFLYNSDRTHVLGSFTHENNIYNTLFPVSPVYGDEIIIEYSEPINVAFEGQLRISEVNHAYRDMLKNEPARDSSDYLCMPDILCTNVEHEENIQAAVLLIINGNTLCSGTLINNSTEDGAPYVLTAVHCFNTTATFPQKIEYYNDRAETMIAFFNYNKATCNTKMRGVEELSLAVFYPLTIIENYDIALLRLKNETRIPDYYIPYFAGWNMTSNGGSKPYENIHHPNGAVTKYGNYDGNLVLSSYGSPFASNSHWMLRPWTIGSTYRGSSGSALFDNEGLIVGGLTGGSSYCSGQRPGGGADYFYAMYKGWEYDITKPYLQLKSWLDPLNLGNKKQSGYDPYKDRPLSKLSNAEFNTVGKLANTTIQSPNEGFLFGHNSLQQVTEFAEEFTIDGKAEIVGAYLLCPSINGFSSVSEVMVKVYNGNSHPEEALDSVIFRPKYTNYLRAGGLTEEDKTMYPDSTENFVKFEVEPEVNGKFYITYRITYPTNSRFSIFNTALPPGQTGTAWMKDSDGWFKSENYAPQPLATSLALQPLVRYKKGSSIDSPQTAKERGFYYDRENKILHIDAKNIESGMVAVYAINGQLIIQSFFSGNSSIKIPITGNSGIGIVRIISGEEVETGKIIF